MRPTTCLKVRCVDCQGLLGPESGRLSCDLGADGKQALVSCRLVGTSFPRWERPSPLLLTFLQAEFVNLVHSWSQFSSHLGHGGASFFPQRSDRHIKSNSASPQHRGTVKKEFANITAFSSFASNTQSVFWELGPEVPKKDVCPRLFIPTRQEKNYRKKKAQQHNILLKKY